MNKQTTSVRLDMELYKEVARAAQKEDRSIKKFLERIIRVALKRTLKK